MSGIELGVDGGRPKRRLLQILGPGLITGASDDDPSGIATYSQAGAQFGFAHGLDDAVHLPADGGDPGDQRPHRPRHRPRHRRQHPRSITRPGCCTASSRCCSSPTSSISAPISAPWAMRCGCWSAARAWLYVVAVRRALRARSRSSCSYRRYVRLLKWLDACRCSPMSRPRWSCDVPWGEVLLRHRSSRRSSLEAGLRRRHRRRVRHHDQPLSLLLAGLAGGRGRARSTRGASRCIERAGAGAARSCSASAIDTYVGMGFSNAHRACSSSSPTAATLHAHGITDIQTSAQAAEALRPIAGDFAFAAVRARHHRHRPAGRAGAGGLGRLCARRGAGLAGRARPRSRPEAKAFYGTIAAATLIGIGINFIADRSDQGAVLERGDQRRRRRADHGGDDADGAATDE